MTNLLTDSKTFNTLLKNFTPQITEQLTIDSLTNAPITLHYGLTPLNKSTRTKFQKVIEELKIKEKIALILNNQPWNRSENKSVEHHQCRTINPPTWISSEQTKWTLFYTKTKSQFTDIVQVGIGGSELGPKALIHALQNNYKQLATPHFMSSIDTFSIEKKLNSLNLETTLFIIVSKSGTTTETQYIWTKIKEHWKKNSLLLEKLKQHSISVTCPNTPLDNPAEFQHCFYIQPSIGGRFSISSAVGGVITSLIYGPDCFNEFLTGANALDPPNIEIDIQKNSALLNACLTITYRNLCHYPTSAIIPYSNALKYIPNYLQQLICESNGKSKSMNGKTLPYATNPAIMTGIGTNAQHSTFQQFYEGSDIIPVTFIGIQNNALLNKHISAQAIALHKKNRPNTIIMLKNLSAYSIGALISFYENTVLFEGLLWGINSFDQPGIELGKTLLKENSPKVKALHSKLMK